MSIEDREREELVKACSGAGLDPRAEIGELEAVRELMNDIDNGKNVSKELKDMVEAIRAINTEGLWGIIDGNTMHEHLQGIISDIRHITIRTDTVELIIMYNPDNNTVTAGAYPMRDGKRVLLGSETTPKGDEEELLGI